MSKFPRRIVTAAIALVLTGGGVVATGPAAGAHEGHGEAGHKHDKGNHHVWLPKVMASGLFTPLSTAIDRDGTAYVAEAFAGRILKIRPGKSPKVIYTDPDGNEVAGLSVHRKVLTFTVSRSDPETGHYSGTWVKRLHPNGKVRTIADTYRHETKRNPDGWVRYGFRDSDPTCDAKWPTDMGVPASYRGIEDSHPYATATSHGWTFVADAAGNDILAVSPHGRLRTVAVMPAVRYTITAEAAASLNLDPCFVGRDYYFENVPTDVEVGPHGKLYVSSLPGGPESPELGARGAVYTVDPGKHRVRKIAGDLLGATGVAVSPHGTVYATQMFGNEITRLKHSRHHHGMKRSVLATPTMPGAVEWSRWGVIATTDVLTGADGTSEPAGKLVRYGF